MTTENPGQLREEAFLSSGDDDPGAAVPSSVEQAPDHTHEQGNRAWYTILSEDWLATIAGLLLVVLLLFRILHSIP